MSGTCTSSPVPCVWVVTSHRTLGNEHGQPQCYTVMDEVGTRTVTNMGLQAVSYPRAPVERLDALLDGVDGLLLGGSATNVHPSLYGEEPLDPRMEFDRLRDEQAQHLVRLAIARRVPLIGFCRGSHDMNVALGGSLYQRLQDLGGSVTHWEDPYQPLDEQYAERHAITCVDGGELEKMACHRRFEVSSLHSQGARRLGEGLVAEAHADDGLVEAFRWHDESQFAWGFQFHPEWGWRSHPCYGEIMGRFAQACWQRKESRVRLPQSPRPARTASRMPAGA